MAKKFELVDQGGNPWSFSGTAYLRYDGKTVGLFTNSTVRGNVIEIENLQADPSTSIGIVGELLARMIADDLLGQMPQIDTVKFEFWSRNDPSENPQQKAALQQQLLFNIGAAVAQANNPNSKEAGRLIVRGIWPKAAWTFATVQNLQQVASANL